MKKKLSPKNYTLQPTLLGVLATAATQAALNCKPVDIVDEVHDDDMIPTGIKAFDSQGFKRGDLITIGAMSGAGQNLVPAISGAGYLSPSELDAARTALKQAGLNPKRFLSLELGGEKLPRGKKQRAHHERMMQGRVKRNTRLLQESLQRILGPDSD